MCKFSVKRYTRCSLKVKLGHVNCGQLRIGFWYFNQSKIHLVQTKRLVETAEILRLMVDPNDVYIKAI